MTKKVKKCTGWQESPKRDPFASECQNGGFRTGTPAETSTSLLIAGRNSTQNLHLGEFPVRTAGADKYRFRQTLIT